MQRDLSLVALIGATLTLLVAVATLVAGLAAGNAMTCAFAVILAAPGSLLATIGLYLRSPRHKTK